MRVPEKIEKKSFCVIGLEGSSEQGEDFVQCLWQEANARFAEVAPLALKDAEGNLVGVWGAMTDCTRAFLPWQEGFTKGLYLAGIECGEEAVPPQGWSKWTVPGFVFLRAEHTGPETFGDMLRYLEHNGLSLAGAVQDFTCPATGKNYMLFPIERL